MKASTTPSRANRTFGCTGKGSARLCVADQAGVGSRSVVLLDDERVIADMYGMALEARGFSLAAYSDAPTFFESLESSVPDVVLLDWKIGTTTGGEVLARLRGDSRT